MADNVNVTEGSGKTVATDDNDGLQYQKIKLMGGDPNSASPIMGDSTYGMDVDVTRMPELASGTNVIGGDLDVAGTYYVQGYLELGSGFKGYTTITSFDAIANL